MIAQELALWEEIGRLPRRVDPPTASTLFEMVEHRKFQNALGEHWQVDEDGNVEVQSVCWLFCWAETGLNSRRTAEDCRVIFNRLFHFGDGEDAYTWFSHNIGGNAARDFRYRRPREIEL